MKLTKLFAASLVALSSVFFVQCSKSDVLSGLPSINSDNNKSVGASAKELLTTSKSKLVIEIQYMTGYQLQASSVNNLVSFYQNYLNKPGGVQVIQKEIPASTKDPLTLTEIAQIEKDNRTAFNTAEQVAVYILVTNGGYTSSNVLGLAYRNTSLCLFGKIIHDNSGGIGQASRVKLESTVANHEAGHIMGLVDVGTPMVTNHKDASHPDHCNNSNCLMYYASETTDILGFLLTGNIPDLDQNCKMDIQANGGK